MWEDFKTYEKLLWKLVWKWMAITRHKYQPNELFNELVIVYANSWNTWQTGREMADWRGKSDEEFRFLLGRSCWTHLCDFIIRRNKVVQVSIDDVIIEASSPEFTELFTRFFFEALDTLVTSEYGKEILDVLIHRRELLEKAKASRTAIFRTGSTSIPRKRQINREDMKYYFCKLEGWKCQDFSLGMTEVEKAYRQLLKVG